MLTFAVIMILLTIIALFLGIGGAVFVVVFGDIIVCIALIVKIIKCLARKK